jgi:Na+/phosphate symporter
MSDRIQIAMADATEALLKADVILAQEVITGDDSIDNLNAQIELKANEVLSDPDLQPAESFLAMSVIEIAAALAQMGDEANQVAKQTRLHFPDHLVSPDLQPEFQKMSQTAIQIIDQASVNLAKLDLVSAKTGTTATTKSSVPSEKLLQNPVGHHFERFANYAIATTSRINNLVETGAFELPSAINSGELTK